MSSDVPSAIFNGSIFSELLCTARCTLNFNNFILRKSDLFSRMTEEGGKRTTLTKRLKQTFHCYRTVFQDLLKLTRK